MCPVGAVVVLLLSSLAVGSLGPTGTDWDRWDRLYCIGLQSSTVSAESTTALMSAARRSRFRHRTLSSLSSSSIPLPICAAPPCSVDSFVRAALS